MCFSLVSCGGKGDTGPEGATGPTGATGVTGPTGVDLTWEVVGSTGVTANYNMGYMTDNPLQVTVTLPASDESKIGNVIWVSDGGHGGWKIAQNAGQKISVTDLPSYHFGWTDLDAADAQNWSSIASSEDGTKLAAVVYSNGMGAGYIHTSTDSGVAWTPQTTAGYQSWMSVAMAQDGAMLIGAPSGSYLTTGFPPATTTTTGTPGYLVGDPYASISLQYAGDGLFNIIYFAGSITPNSPPSP